MLIKDLHAEARPVFGQWSARGDERGGAGGFLDRAGSGEGAWIVRQVGDQTGRPVAEQRGRGPLGLVRFVGSRGRGRAARDRRGDGLDRLRRRQSIHARAAPRHAPRRATPLLWLTVDKDELKNQRNDFEDLCLSRLKAAARGRGRDELGRSRLRRRQIVRISGALGCRYVIRFRGNILVSAADGETRLAVDWVGKGGRARKLHDAEITAARHKVAAVVCVKAAGMSEPWHLAASDGSLPAPEIIKLYSKRWTIESSFRDSKDLRFGMGMSALRIDDPLRRDRLLLLNAFAILLTPHPGAPQAKASAWTGSVQISTVKRRVHSLSGKAARLDQILIPSSAERPGCGP